MNIAFKNKKIAILGLGVEGMASVKYLKEQGAEVTVLDQKSREEIGNEVISNREKLGVKFVLGKDYLRGLDQYEAIVRSPGIRRNLPELIEAGQKGVIITSQTKIFFDLCPCQIIGVTGTKGKGTTSSLIYEMLKAQGFDAYLGGNIGQPPLDFLDKLSHQPASPDASQGGSKVVLELSSYQLEDLSCSPHIAVVLMITSEHLAPDKAGLPHQNYHVDIDDYVEAKRNILKSQSASDFAVINRDYPASNESDIHTQAQVFWVSRERGVLERGCFVEDGKVIIQNSESRIQNSKIEIIHTKDILLPGKHNLENVCAAVMAAVLTGVSKQNIASVLKTFKGLEHRLELVGEVKGVKYYDDSFSTVPETAMAAIQAFREPEILILGGARKGSDFSELGRVIAQAKNIKAIIGIGIEWPRIKEGIRNPRFAKASRGEQESGIMLIEGAKDMKTIVIAASKIAKSGDVVILSPACSSFDMFKNYKERGEQFKEEVGKLKTQG